MSNLFSDLPDQLTRELFEPLLEGEMIRIERILSQGQTSPDVGWYDQEEDEWVVLLQGGARLLFDDGEEVSLSAGDTINIPAHRRHRVSWTDPERISVWLAVFYRGGQVSKAKE